MPMEKKRNYNLVIVYGLSSNDSDSTKTNADKDSSDAEDNPEDTGLKAEIGREIEKIRAQTPILTSPIGCSTEIATNAAQRDQSGTPIHGQETDITAAAEEELSGEPRSKQKIKVEKNKLELNQNHVDPKG